MSMVEFGIEKGYISNDSTDDEEVFVILLKTIPTQIVLDKIKKEFSDNEFHVEYDGKNFVARRIKPQKEREIIERLNKIDNIRKFREYYKNVGGEELSNKVISLVFGCSEMVGLPPEVALGCFFSLTQDKMFDGLTED